nr:hypothetical protein [Hymenobacter montanus]
MFPNIPGVANCLIKKYIIFNHHGIIGSTGARIYGPALAISCAGSLVISKNAVDDIYRSGIMRDCYRAPVRISYITLKSAIIDSEFGGYCRSYCGGIISSIVVKGRVSKSKRPVCNQVNSPTIISRIILKGATVNFI